MIMIPNGVNTLPIWTNEDVQRFQVRLKQVASEGASISVDGKSVSIDEAVNARLKFKQEERKRKRDGLKVQAQT